jgi:hypothetical protein
MSPALRSDSTGHLSRRIKLMDLPFEHVSDPDATGDSSSEIDSHFHSGICLEKGLSRIASTAAERSHDSASSKKPAACS